MKMKIDNQGRVRKIEIKEVKESRKLLPREKLEQLLDRVLFKPKKKSDKR
jgi:hypothetical protein